MCESRPLPAGRRGRGSPVTGDGGSRRTKHRERRRSRRRWRPSGESRRFALIACRPGLWRWRRSRRLTPTLFVGPPPIHRQNRGSLPSLSDLRKRWTLLLVGPVLGPGRGDRCRRRNQKDAKESEEDPSVALHRHQTLGQGNRWRRGVPQELTAGSA